MPRALRIELYIRPEGRYAHVSSIRFQGHRKSKVSLSASGPSLRITIEADDATALRASANSVLRDLQVAEAAYSASGKRMQGRSNTSPKRQKSKDI